MGEGNGDNDPNVAEVLIQIKVNVPSFNGPLSLKNTHKLGHQMKMQPIKGPLITEDTRGLWRRI